MNGSIDGLGLGWLRDHADFRDYTPEHPAITPVLKPLKVDPSPPKKTVKLASSVDLRSTCSPIENQGALGACTAHAGVGLLECFERRATGTYLDASRRFLYKVTRDLLGWTGDTGAFLRSTMGAMALFGVPPEKYWPYVISDFDVEPPAFCYAFAQNYQALLYFRLDPPGLDKTVLVNRIKYFLTAKFPSMFGFSVYNSISQAASTGEIPYPASEDKMVGGHAIVAVGYDDAKTIVNHRATGSDLKSKGAFLIRNSWGTGWGDQGYGWLPYDYVLKGLATDWWSLFKNEWVPTKQFGF